MCIQRRGGWRFECIACGGVILRGVLFSLVGMVYTDCPMAWDCDVRGLVHLFRVGNGSRVPFVLSSPSVRLCSV